MAFDRTACSAKNRERTKTAMTELMNRVSALESRVSSLEGDVSLLHGELKRFAPQMRLTDEQLTIVHAFIKEKGFI